MIAADFSSNEIFNIAYRAFRGAGWYDGVAEDGARAVVFLSQVGLDGIEAAMQAVDRDASTRDGLRIETRALDQGISAIDWVLSGKRNRVELPYLDVPLLVWGLCCVASHETGFGLGCLTKNHIDPGQGGAVSVCPEWAKTMLICGSDTVVCCLREEMTLHLPLSTNLRITSLENTHLSKAKKLAHKTYVPATDSSRYYGAGSTKSDND